MRIISRIKATVQRSKKFGQKYAEKYVSFSTKLKQLTLKKPTVLLLCKQAKSRVEKLKSLEPDAREGLIAKIEQNEVLVTVHFAPEQIVLHETYLEGQLRLLTSPNFETESLFHRLIIGWKTFLGGKVPQGGLPDGLTIKDDKIYYTFPRNQVPLLDTLFSGVETDSVLTTELRQGELTITASVAINWKDLKIRDLLQIINIVPEQS